MSYPVSNEITSVAGHSQVARRVQIQKQMQRFGLMIVNYGILRAIKGMVMRVDKWLEVDDPSEW